MNHGAKFVKATDLYAKRFATCFIKRQCEKKAIEYAQGGKPQSPDDRDSKRLRTMHSRTPSISSFRPYSSTNSLLSLSSLHRNKSYDDSVLRPASPKSVPPSVFVR